MNRRRKKNARKTSKVIIYIYIYRIYSKPYAQIINPASAAAPAAFDMHECCKNTILNKRNTFLFPVKLGVLKKLIKTKY